MDQKSSKIEHTKYSCRRTAKDIQNPPADAQPSLPADAQPRIYEIFLPTPRARNNEKIRYNGGESMGGLWPGGSVRTPKLPFTKIKKNKTTKLPLTIYHLTLTHAVARSAVADTYIRFLRLPVRGLWGVFRTSIQTKQQQQKRLHKNGNAQAASKPFSRRLGGVVEAIWRFASENVSKMM